jgi:hypothetical protein
MGFESCLINKKLTDIVNENELTQIVREPTRGNNIIDLMFTTNPGLISSVEVHPGMSDHNVTEDLVSRCLNPSLYVVVSAKDDVGKVTFTSFCDGIDGFL